MGEGPELCGHCERLDLKSDPVQLKLGRGRCLGHEGSSAARPAIGSWSDRACVLFNPARPMAPRGRWIEKWQAKQQNEVQAETKG